MQSFRINADMTNSSKIILCEEFEKENDPTVDNV